MGHRWFGLTADGLLQSRRRASAGVPSRPATSCGVPAAEARRLERTGTPRDIDGNAEPLRCRRCRRDGNSARLRRADREQEPPIRHDADRPCLLLRVVRHRRRHSGADRGRAGRRGCDRLHIYAADLHHLLRFFEAFFDRTPGKFVCGTRVVSERGTAPTLGQVVGRTFARWIPFEPFSVLFSEDGDARGWHDSIAKTKVIRAR